MTRSADSQDQEMVYSSRQEVHWVGSGHDILYRVELTDLQPSGAWVRITVKNLGEKPVYILADRDWLVWVQDRAIRLSWGNSSGSYGNEVPALTPIVPGSCVVNASYVSFSAVEESDIILAVTVGFYAMVDAPPDLVAELNQLEDVSGWWQMLGDIELTERYYDELWYPMVSFPLPREQQYWGLASTVASGTSTAQSGQRGLTFTTGTALVHELGHAHGYVVGQQPRRCSGCTNSDALHYENLHRQLIGKSAPKSVGTLQRDGHQ